jgi:hypothetical protein
MPMIRHRTTAATVTALLLASALAGTAEAAVPRIVFPVVAKNHYTDDFGALRGQGSHEGNDIMARKKTRVVAAESGYVTVWNHSARAGCMLYLHGRSGTVYLYVHLNNDTTMRNDNRGGCRRGVAYSPSIRPNGKTPVQAGQLLGYVGDSGDADGIASHLHFELHPNGGRAVSPYQWLQRGWRLLYMRPPAAAKTLKLKIYGRVVGKRLDLEPSRLQVQVSLVQLSNRSGVRPARSVTVSVPAEAAVMRSGEAGRSRTTLAKAEVGERVVVWTGSFPQTIAYARAAAARHAAAQILLRGD